MGTIEHTTPDISTVVEHLSNMYLTVEFTSSMGRRTKTDRAATDELTRTKGAKAGAARAVKDLYHGANEEIREIESIISGARTLHYRMTAPFSPTGNNTGARLLSNEDLLRDEGYTSSMAQAKRDLSDALDKLETVYDYRVQEAMANLGGLANEDDYPSFWEFKSQCSIGFTMDAIPGVNRWNKNALAMQGKLHEQLTNHTLKNVQRQVESAVKDAMGRVAEPLARLIKATTQNPETEKYPRFFDTAIDNMRDVVRALRAFNLYNDADVTAIAREIEDKLCAYTPEQVRANAALKEDLNESATEIADMLEAMDWAA